jgi:phosphoenolpyruvate phosphomutase
MIFDGDTGGQPEHLAFTIKSLERLGVSAIVIEDKIGLKKNSLLGNDVKQTQDDIKNFSYKIELAKKAQTTEEFMVIARIESLILQKGIKDAIMRAKSYIDAGADGILIHSRSRTPNEVFKFSKLYREFGLNYPLFCVPTSYNKVKESQLIDNGFKAVIYANHLIRASYPAMENAALKILKYKRSFEIEKSLMSIKDILQLIPGTK